MRHSWAAKSEGPDFPAEFAKDREALVSAHAARIRRELADRGDPIIARGSFRRVRCIETGAVWASVSEAARANGIEKVDNICQAINRGGRCKKFHWEYITTPPDQIVSHAIKLTGSSEDLRPWLLQFLTQRDETRSECVTVRDLCEQAIARQLEITTKVAATLLPPWPHSLYDPFVGIPPNTAYGLRIVPPEVLNLIAERNEIDRKIQSKRADRYCVSEELREAILSGFVSRRREISRNIVATLTAPPRSAPTAPASATPAPAVTDCIRASAVAIPKPGPRFAIDPHHAGIPQVGGAARRRMMAAAMNRAAFSAAASHAPS